MSFQSFQIIDDLSVGELMDYEDCLDLSPDFLPETTSQPSVTTIRDRHLNLHRLLLSLHIGAQKILS